MENVKLLQGDCLELMQQIPDGSVDMILCGRRFIGMELDWGYFNTAANRITEAVQEIHPGALITMDEMSPLPTL